MKGSTGKDGNGDANWHCPRYCSGCSAAPLLLPFFLLLLLLLLTRNQLAPAARTRRWPISCMLQVAANSPLFPSTRYVCAHVCVLVCVWVSEWQSLITLQLRHLHIDREIMEIFRKAHFLLLQPARCMCVRVCVCAAYNFNFKLTAYN